MPEETQKIEKEKKSSEKESPKPAHQSSVEESGQADKILWIQGVAQGENERALFTLAGYLKQTGHLVSEVFVTTEKVDMPSTDLTPLDFRAALYTISRNAMAEGEKTIALRNTLQGMPLSEWAKAYQTEKEKGLKQKVESSLAGEISKLFPEAQMRIGFMVVEEKEYQSWQEQKRKIAIGSEQEEEELQKGQALPQEISLRVQVAIDPAHGKGVSDLYQGEKVLVRIADDRPLAQSIAQLLLAKSGNEWGEGKLIAEAQEAVLLPSGRYKLYLRFGPGILGECVLSDKVKVKVIPEAELEPEELPELLGMPVKVTPYFLGAAIVVVLLFSLLVLFRLMPP